MFRVLLPVDRDEERALAQAQFVASLPNATEAVTGIVLYVFEESGSRQTAEEPDQYRRSVNRVGAVRRARDYLSDNDVDVTVIEESTNAAERIVTEAEDREVDAIVLGGRKRPLVSEAILGSTTQSVLRNTEIPVVVAGSEVE